MANLPHHEPDWDEQLWEWIDGKCGRSQANRIALHVQACCECQREVEQFRQLDGQLRRAAARPSLGASFDRRLLEQIVPFDEAHWSAARRRIAREVDADRARLEQSRQRALMQVLPGILAGAVTALGLAECLGSSQFLSEWLLGAAQGLHLNLPHGIQPILTAVAGAAIGGSVGSWLVSVTD